MKTKKSAKIVETNFDIAYLCVAYIITMILFISSYPPSNLRWQFAVVALILAIGDTFHLIPRVRIMWNESGGYTRWLGFGKLVSSLTMTVFYLGLWHIGANVYGINNMFLLIFMIILAVLRIVLCLMPQNKWLLDASPYKWQIIRNIPFIIMCLLVMVLFIFGTFGSRLNTTDTQGLNYLWLAILISILCYLPVILFANKYPKIGMLMIPKTCAYIAILLMGFSIPVV